MLKDIVYKKLREVPRGKVTTYKLLAEACGVKCFRGIGQILKHNPFAPTVPCHRVVRSNGEIGGFMGQISGDGVDKKIKLLEDEGIVIEGGKILEFEKFLYDFS